MPIDYKSYFIAGGILLIIVTIGLFVPVGVGYLTGHFELGVVVGSIIATISIIIFSDWVGSWLERRYIEKFRSE